MSSCDLSSTLAVGNEMSLDQPEERLLSKEEKQRFQVIAGSVMYFGQMTYYDLMYASTNWRGQYLNRPKLTWGQPNTYFFIWPGRWILSSRTSKVSSSWRRFLMLTWATTRAWQAYVLLCRLPFERSGELQAGAARTDSTIHYGSRARSRSAGDEAGGVLL